jgi:hypothetical protein
MARKKFFARKKFWHDEVLARRSLGTKKSWHESNVTAGIIFGDAAAVGMHDQRLPTTTGSGSIKQTATRNRISISQTGPWWENFDRHRVKPPLVV